MHLNERSHEPWNGAEEEQCDRRYDVGISCVSEYKYVCMHIIAVYVDSSYNV